MIDTLRLVGPAINYIRPFTWEKGYYFKDLENKTEKHATALVENRPNLWRVYYSPAYGTISVELNPHKILFSNNIYNYEQNHSFLRKLIFDIGSFFYGSGSWFVSRIDIGGVFTYDSRTTCRAALEKFRATRIEGSRSEKFKHQSYKDAVFYSTRNWSVKIYNKGVEMKISENDTFYPFDLLSTLRFEKTYRFRELERLGMPVEAYKGVHKNNLNTQSILNNFFETFRSWEFNSTPWLTEKKGVIGLLSVIDSAGALSEVETMKTVSHSSFWRYRKEKKKASEIEIPVTIFCNNCTADVQKKWEYVRTTGVAGTFALAYK
jgi:hypothetical protein